MFNYSVSSPLFIYYSFLLKKFFFQWSLKWFHYTSLINLVCLQILYSFMDLAAIQSQFLPSILCVIIFIPFTLTCTVNSEHIATIIASNTEYLSFRTIKDKKRDELYFYFIYLSRLHDLHFSVWILVSV